MNKKVISEYNLDLIQKIHLSFVLLVLIVIVFISKIDKIFFFQLIDFISPLLIILLVAIIISKSGLLIKNKMLYKGYFVLGVLIYKKEINIKNKPIVSILKLKKSHGMPTFGLASPQSAHSFYKYYAYLLDNSHTEKFELIGCKKKTNAEKIIIFLNENLHLKYQTYSPNFSLKNNN